MATIEHEVYCYVECYRRRGSYENIRQEMNDHAQFLLQNVPYVAEDFDLDGAESSYIWNITNTEAYPFLLFLQYFTGSMLWWTKQSNHQTSKTRAQ